MMQAEKKPQDLKNNYASYFCLPFGNQLFRVCILRLLFADTMLRKFHLNKMHDHKTP